MKHVFERYYRVESRGNVAGSGIGLYLRAEIIKRHQGKIWAESEAGKGSVFILVCRWGILVEVMS